MALPWIMYAHSHFVIYIYIYYLVLFNGREGHVISKINIWYILYIIYYMVRVVGCRCAMCNVQCARQRKEQKKKKTTFIFIRWNRKRSLWKCYAGFILPPAVKTMKHHALTLQDSLVYLWGESPLMYFFIEK